jgi:hypothetical protein
MIESISVIARPLAPASGDFSTTAALIAIATPGSNPALPPGVCNLLRMEFDTLEAELEAASLRVVGAAPAVPFSALHALRIAAFLAGLHAGAATCHVFVCESEGLSRSVTIARWAARRWDLAAHAARIPDHVPSCWLMARQLASAATSAAQTHQAIAMTARRTGADQPMHQSMPKHRAGASGAWAAG